MTRPVKAVVFDLDGTLLDTGILATSSKVFAKLLLAVDDTAMHSCRDLGAGGCDHNCGAVWQEADPRSAAGKPGSPVCPQPPPSLLTLSRCNAALQASSGRRPLEAWQAVADLLGINRTAQQLFDESEPLLEHRSAPNLSGWRCGIKASQLWHHGRACFSHCVGTRPNHTATSCALALSKDTHSQLESLHTRAHLRAANAPLYRRHGANPC